MEKIKRILALAGAVLLVFMYIATLVFALLKSPYYEGLFRASLALTIILPVLLYGYIVIYRLLKNRNEDKETLKDKDSED
ncbi:MAG: hypothetical protein K5886_00410 [Lachnospiraceae bacterium]|nr:hypothetical protein [Lachnospiraceae bacterium]